MSCLKTFVNKSITVFNFRNFFFVIMLLYTIQTRAQVNTDFSGHWERITERCDPGPGLSVNSIPVSFDIKKSSDVVIIKTTRRNGNGEITVLDDTLRTDGSVIRRVMPNGVIQNYSLKPGAGKGSFTTDFASEDNSGNALDKSKKAWLITPDGTLQITVDLSSNGKDYHLSEIFEKK